RQREPSREPALQPVLRTAIGGQREAMNDPLGDEHVVTRAKLQLAEAADEGPVALLNEQQCIAAAVLCIGLVADSRTASRELDVLVAEQRCSFGPDISIVSIMIGSKVPTNRTGVMVGRLRLRRRFEPSKCVWSVFVIEDRVRTIETGTGQAQ